MFHTIDTRVYKKMPTSLLLFIHFLLYNLLRGVIKYMIDTTIVYKTKMDTRIEVLKSILCKENPNLNLDGFSLHDLASFVFYKQMGNDELLKNLVFEHDIPIPDNAIKCAISKGNIGFVEWLLYNGQQLGKRALASARSKETIEWLLKKGVEEIYIYNCLVEMDDVECAKEYLERGILKKDYTNCELSVHSIKMAKFLVENGFFEDDDYIDMRLSVFKIREII